MFQKLTVQQLNEEFFRNGLDALASEHDGEDPTPLIMHGSPVVFTTASQWPTNVSEAIAAIAADIERIKAEQSAAHKRFREEARASRW